MRYLEVPLSRRKLSYRDCKPLLDRIVGMIQIGLVGYYLMMLD